MNNKRTCGECTLCCKTHGIRELMKAPGQWCPHCTVGKGCTIYATRPISCGDFQCMWLRGFGLPEYRPDKTGIVPTVCNIPLLGFSVFLYAEHDTALDSPFARSQTALNLGRRVAVIHIPLEKNPQLYLPPGKKGGKYRFTALQSREVEVIPFQEGRF